MTIQEVDQDNSAAKPLITFALFSYNQENYIRDAIEGAFSQTYSPLQIVLSDDGSSDRTFEIMQELAERYQGPHRITLNRNPRNIGITDHLNLVGEISDGQYICLAAGDDISMPDRVERLFVLCKTSGSIIAFSDVNHVDENFAPAALNEHRSTGLELTKTYDAGAIRDGFHLGPSYLVSREIFKTFPRMLAGVHHEDILFPIRAKLLKGKIAHTNRKLIHYRSTVGVTSDLQRTIAQKPSAALKKINERSFALAHQILIDANSIGTPISERLAKPLAFWLIEKYFLEKRWGHFLSKSFFSIAAWRYKRYLVRTFLPRRMVSSKSR